VMDDQRDVMLMRLVDRGELVAQCNVAVVPQRSVDKIPTLTTFKAQITKVLGTNFKAFTRIRQTKTKAGLRVLQAVATGTASDLPIQWNYFHVSDDRGNQVIFAFTLEAALVDRFGTADWDIVNRLEFLPPKLAKKPDPADKHRGQ